MQRTYPLYWDWPTSALLAGALLTAAYRLSLTGWAPGLDVCFTAALLGCMLGLALGSSRFGRIGVLVISAAYTAVLIPWLLTTTVESQAYMLTTLSNIGGRLGFAAGQVAAHIPVQDPLLFLAAMTALFWVMSVHGAFFLVRRRSVLVAILPSALGITLIQYYDSYGSGRLGGVGFFFFLALMLAARANLMEQSEGWHARRIFASPEANYDLTTAALVTASIIVLSAWVLPELGSPIEAARTAWQRLTTPFNALNERLADALAPLRGSGGSAPPQFGSTLDLGRSVASSPDILFTVSAPSLDTPRYYWRGRTYDTYTNGQWLNTQETIRTFSPRNRQDLPLPYSAGRTLGSFVFTLQSDRRSLVAPAEPRWFSRDVRLVTAPAQGPTYDLLAINPTEILRGGESYEVRAAVAAPSITDLRSAGTDYPAWVAARYLQLPADFSPRIANLARTLTATAMTPYDQAQQITDYLRNTITYAESVETPPPGADPLEWFLFETKSGFCNYYATSQVLMLRAVGVPARLAVGYAQGETQQAELFVVRARDYHAWPEVYFPGIGWVEFEPTSSQSALTRPLGQISSTPGESSQPGNLPATNSSETGQNEEEQDKIDLFEQDPSTAERARTQRQQAQIVVWLTAVVVGAGFGVALLRLSRNMPLLVRIPLAIRAVYERSNLPTPLWVERWLGWMSLTPIERAFQSINHALRLLDSPPPVAATPAERAATLVRLLPEAAAPIHNLAAEHEASLFTPHPGDEKRARQAQWRIYLLAFRRKIFPPEEKPAP